MGTTPKGILYVDPTSHPLEFPAAMQQQSSTIDSLLDGVDAVGARRSLVRSGAHSAPHNTSSPITGGWAAAAGDGGNGLLTYSGGILTVTQAAVLDISLWLVWTGATTGRRLIEITADGSAVASQIVWPTDTAAPYMSTGIVGQYFAAGAQLQARCFQSSGAALAVNDGRWNVRRVSKS